jgi:aerobic carbon-monoxide dehydrogenase small subunit
LMTSISKEIELRVNGESYQVRIEPHRTLLEVLREELFLTGTKEGCGTGDCGACTVILDGKPVLSCITLAVEADGREVTTIEGFSKKGVLHPLQEAFLNEGAVQCGFCTPGMIITSKTLLDENDRPTEPEIRKAMAGNLCRCTGYAKIVKAIQSIAEDKKESE